MQNKNYLVVGGSSGIGLGIVEQLALEGAQVFNVSRTSENLNHLPAIHHQQIDVLEDDFELDLPDELHGLVFCPGSINLKPFRSLKLESFRNDFELNLVGAVKILQKAQKNLHKTPGASVVLFSTIAVQTGMPYHASVASAKGALEGLTKSLAAEWAPKIRVNCIAPSLTDTPLAARLLSSDERKETSAKRHPLQRVGNVRDISETACFLLSEKSSWMTGQILKVDGGLSTIKL